MKIDGNTFELYTGKHIDFFITNFWFGTCNNAGKERRQSTFAGKSCPLISGLNLLDRIHF